MFYNILEIIVYFYVGFCVGYTSMALIKDFYNHLKNNGKIKMKRDYYDY